MCVCAHPCCLVTDALAAGSCNLPGNNNIPWFPWGLKFICIKFKTLKSLKLFNKVLIMISRGLRFGDGKTRIAIMAECDD